MLYIGNEGGNILFGEIGGSLDGYIFPNHIHDFRLPFNLFLFEFHQYGIIFIQMRILRTIRVYSILIRLLGRRTFLFKQIHRLLDGQCFSSIRRFYGVL